jgi:hypothetical protein
MAVHALDDVLRELVRTRYPALAAYLEAGPSAGPVEPLVIEVPEPAAAVPVQGRLPFAREWLRHPDLGRERRRRRRRPAGSATGR